MQKTIPAIKEIFAAVSDKLSYVDVVEHVTKSSRLFLLQGFDSLQLEQQFEALWVLVTTQTWA